MWNEIHHCYDLVTGLESPNMLLHHGCDELLIKTHGSESQVGHVAK